MKFSLNRRILVLAGFLAVTFATVFLIPSAPELRASRLMMELPAQIGPWESREIQVSENELRILAEDTHFERRVYQRAFDSSHPSVEASIVFSGEDMNNSIHRPEVCMRTQGWNFVSESYVTWPKFLADGSDLNLREVLSSKTRRNPETGEPVRLPNGELMQDWQLLYYTFIGARTITPDHYERTFADTRDRVLGGYDQRWAYATFSTMVPAKYAEQGIDLGVLEPLDRKQTTEYLAEFMGTLLNRCLLPADATAPTTAAGTTGLSLSSDPS